MQTYAEQRNEIHKRQTRAALCIQRTYSRFRDRTIFNFLKSAMCRAVPTRFVLPNSQKLRPVSLQPRQSPPRWQERAVSSELLKRINPGESYILRDPAMTGKIRLRYALSCCRCRDARPLRESTLQIRGKCISASNHVQDILQSAADLHGGMQHDRPRL